MKKYLDTSKMTTQQEIITLTETSPTLLHLIEDHLRLITENIYLPHCQICFSPQDVDFTKFQDYPQSSYDPKLLSRRAYLRREEHKDDLRRFDALVQALVIFTVQQDIYLAMENQGVIDSFLLPKVFNFSQKSLKSFKVPAGEKIIFLGYPEAVNSQCPEIISNAACLFPGKIKSTPDGYVYTSSSLDEAISLLDKKNNYSIEAPLLNLDKKETLESLKQKLIAYLRMKIKPSLQNPRSCLYQLNNPDDDLPLEKYIDHIFDGNIGTEESLLFREFPLIFSSLTDEVVLFVDEEKAIIEETNKYIDGSQEGKFIILNPVLASEQRSEKYSLPISVEMRALHINYAFQLTSSQDSTNTEPLYEDFLGEANWVLAPIVILKSNGFLHGKVEVAPYYCEEFLFSPLEEEEIETSN